ncbi:MAG: hypothetical protein IJG25_02100 [Thermoguttaceae bacterium]|nr:hypothetical protein [Thermoguttaceae bacterium]
MRCPFCGCEFIPAPSWAYACCEDCLRAYVESHDDGGSMIDPATGQGLEYDGQDYEGDHFDEEEEGF